MIVTQLNCREIINKISQTGFYSLDTETTGLRWFDDDSLFSIIIADAEQEYYFNFNHTPDHLGNLPSNEYILPASFLEQLRAVLRNKDSTWFLHNAKFDMGMLFKAGLLIYGRTHCTEAMARLVNSSYKKYNLDICLKRMNADLKIKGVEKSDIVKEYVQEHKLFTDIYPKGKKKKVRLMHYDKIPFEIMVEYACIDARGTWNLGQYQRKKLYSMSKLSPGLLDVAFMESQLTKTCFNIEKDGIQIDVGYTDRQLDKTMAKMVEIEKEFKEYTDIPFKDSPSVFKKYFTEQGVESKKLTAKGAVSYDKYALKTIDHPVADMILNWRKAQKLGGTYYSSFMHYSTELGKLHAIINQGGTAPGRLSYREPNLQNVPKADPDSEDYEEALAVRRCFVPGDPDYCFFMPDYDQMEYRMMIDQAQEIKLINKILNEGLDVHTATAELVGVPRKAAKTINFLLLYGGGAEKLALSLGISIPQAMAIKQKYFAALPRVRHWIQRTIRDTALDGYITNWMGRIAYLPRKAAYAGPNYKIQGGCAVAMKKAMIQVEDLLSATHSRILVQIHDELLIRMHRNDLHLAQPICDIMKNAYPHKHIPLTVGPKYSWKSWADTVEGFPVYGKTA